MLPCKVLIIEDDSTLALVISEVMKSRPGFEPDVVHSVSAAFEYLGQQPVDMILLDLSLPDADAMNVIPQLTSHGLIPVIVISGRTDDDSRIRALTLGADDYLCKPFHPGELLLRAEKRWQAAQALRPTTNAVVPAASRMIHLQIDDALLALDHQQQCCIKGDQQTRLTTVEFVLLQTLVQGAGSILASDQLLDSLMAELGDHHDFAPASIPVLMHRIRRKIASLHAGQDLIVNVPRRGYQLNPAVQVLHWG